MMEYRRTIAHGMMFHHFHGGEHPRVQGSISQEELDRLIRFVGVWRILDPAEWLEKTETGRLAPEDLCLTFDDALLCQIDIALPLLAKRQLRAFWFINSSVCEGQVSRFEVYRAFRTRHFRHIDDFYRLFFNKVFDSEFSDRAHAVLTDAEIARRMKIFPFYSANDVKFRLIRDHALDRQAYDSIMDELIEACGLSLEALSRNLWMSNEHLRYLTGFGHVVGLHSYSHPMVLAALPYDEQLQEYTRNYEHVRDVCQREPVAMAHPAGSYNDETLEILRRLGIVCGFRSSMAAPGRDGRLNPSPLAIPREDHTNIMNMIER